MKKVLILSRADIIGAGSVAKEIRCFLLSEDKYEIKIYSRYSGLKCEYIISHNSRTLGRLYEFFRACIFKFNQIFNKLIDFDYAPLSINERTGWYNSQKLLKKLNGFVPDIIIVLFMDGFINLKNIYDLYSVFGSSIYFYPMDMAIMTGGCHYSNGCTGFSTGCDNCPIFLIKGSIAKKNILFKDNYLHKFPFKILSGSKEIFDQLKKSYLFKDAIIYNYLLPLDKEIFRPKEVTNAVNLSNGSKKILIGSQTLGLKRKGGDLIIKILNLLSAHLDKKKYAWSVEVIIVGKSSTSYLNLIKLKKQSCGRVPLHTLVDLYNLSDVFISASREDSGPMMVNQSLMCGTPVVSFEVGVAKDLVRDYETGFLIKKFDLDDFASKIEYILGLSPEERMAMRANCRTSMLNIKHVPLV